MKHFMAFRKLFSAKRMFRFSWHLNSPKKVENLRQELTQIDY